MNLRRQPPPPPPPSTASTRPPLVTSITIRLRPRGESATPPPTAPPSSATRTTSPSRVSAAGVVHVEGVPPPPPPPPPAAAAATRARTTSPLFAPKGDAAVEGEGLPPTPPPTATSRTSTAPLVSEADAAVDLELAALPPAADPWGWGDLLPELVIQVACRLRSSRQDVERMLGVCSAWREAIPSTTNPSLVLSRKKPDAKDVVFLLEIARSQQAEHAAFKTKIPLSRPPAGASCWGSALGLLAMQSHHANSRQTFAYCMYCGVLKNMLNLPEESTPKGLFLEPHAPVKFVLMTVGADGDTVLRIDRTEFPWDLEGNLLWLPSPGFDDEPLRSIALSAGILRAAASNNSVIIIDESGRPWDALDEMITLQAPPLFEDDHRASPWDHNGCHLFVCEGKLYYTEIYDSFISPEGVAVQLFLVEKVDHGGYRLVQVRSIGPFCLYLGANQAFVLPAADPLVGRLANTLYVEDFHAESRWPRVFTIPFPQDVASTVHGLLPASWVGLPSDKDIFNHCNPKEHWGWWD